MGKTCFLCSLQDPRPHIDKSISLDWK
uniref:Uncharacterized protein n=1 Tax=Anguilla anguilla TaxID=7936 RepID=A0A0E9TQ03_ANGAN